MPAEHGRQLPEKQIEQREFIKGWCRRIEAIEAIQAEVMHRLIECETQVRRLMFETSAVCESIQQRMRTISKQEMKEAYNKVATCAETR